MDAVDVPVSPEAAVQALISADEPVSTPLTLSIVIVATLLSVPETLGMLGLAVMVIGESPEFVSFTQRVIESPGSSPVIASSNVPGSCVRPNVADVRFEEFDCVVLNDEKTPKDMKAPTATRIATVAATFLDVLRCMCVLPPPGGTGLVSQKW